jgi:hypothetical protein
VWERDGDEWVPGTAIRWDRDHVLVRLGDRRVSSIGVWLAPQDLGSAAERCSGACGAANVQVSGLWGGGTAGFA